MLVNSYAVNKNMNNLKGIYILWSVFVHNCLLFDGLSGLTGLPGKPRDVRDPQSDKYTVKSTFQHLCKMSFYKAVKSIFVHIWNDNIRFCLTAKCICFSELWNWLQNSPTGHSPGVQGIRVLVQFKVTFNNEIHLSGKFSKERKIYLLVVLYASAVIFSK